MRAYRLLLLLLLLPGVLLPGLSVRAAQDDTTPPPTTPAPEEDGVPKIHVVEEGENLTTIAALYEVTVQELMLVNGLGEDDFIFPGQKLTIPGAAGDVVATSYEVQAGDTLPEIAARFNTTTAAIATPNHLVTSNSLYVGQSLAVISKTGSSTPRPITGTLHVVAPGETFLGLAARAGVAPSELAALNELPAPPRVFPGMRLRLPSAETYRLLPGAWRALQLYPLPIVQGDTVAVYVENEAEGVPAGTFAGQSLSFAPYREGYVALVGLDAFTEPGRYPLELSGSGEGVWWPLSQDVQVVAGSYVSQTITVPPELEPLLAPEVRAEEDAFLNTYYSAFSPVPQWEGLFQVPVSNTIVTAPYGGARSYNGGPYEIFHTGVDFGGGLGTAIMAPAAGTVVYAGELTLRGNTLILDHGMGVHSGYYHLSEILAEEGATVTAGQVVARGGNTGLSTGPHLHWELRVMGVPVNGLQWTENPFPLPPE
jgi:murein DD-endopeptidase MepM/ murein hydrolase activator NlpD